jgi:hypothetical protein
LLAVAGAVVAVVYVFHHHHLRSITIISKISPFSLSKALQALFEIPVGESNQGAKAKSFHSSAVMIKSIENIS